MATRLYLRDLTPVESPASHPISSSNIPSTADFKDYGNAVKSLSTEIGTSEATLTGTTQAHTDSDAELVGVFCSDPLSAQTISGTFDYGLQFVTSDATSNSYYGWVLALYRGTGTLVQVLSSSGIGTPSLGDGTWDTTKHGRFLDSFSLNSTANAVSDYLVLEVWRLTNAQDTATGHTSTLYYDGTTAVTENSTEASSASWIEFSFDISFAPTFGVASDGAVLSDTLAGAATEIAATADGAKFGDTQFGIKGGLGQSTDGVKAGDTQAAIATQALGAHTEGVAFSDTLVGAQQDTAAHSEGAALGDTQVVTVTDAPPTDNITSVVTVISTPPQPEGFQDVSIFFDENFPVEVAEISPVYSILTAREDQSHRIGLRMPVDQSVADLNAYGQGLMWGGLSSLRFELGGVTVTADQTVTAYLILDPLAPTLTTDYVFGAGADRRSLPVYDVVELGSVVVPFGQAQFSQFAVDWNVTTDEFTSADANGLSKLDRMNSVIRSANWIGTHLLFELRVQSTVFIGLQFEEDAWALNFTYDPTFDTGRSLPDRARSAVSRVDRCPVCGFATLREDWIIREGTDAQSRRRVCPRCWDPAEPPLRILGPATPPVNEDN